MAGRVKRYFVVVTMLCFCVICPAHLGWTTLTTLTIHQLLEVECNSSVYSSFSRHSIVTKQIGWSSFILKYIGPIYALLSLRILSKLSHLVVLLTCIIHKMPGLNLGRNIRYPDLDFLWFSQSLHTNDGIVSWIRPQPLPSTPFAICHSVPSFQLMLYTLSYWEYH